MELKKENNESWISVQSRNVRRGGQESVPRGKRNFLYETDEGQEILKNLREEEHQQDLMWTNRFGDLKPAPGTKMPRHLRIWLPES